MTNVFDQFDAPQATAQPPANIFDQFDPSNTNQPNGNPPAQANGTAPNNSEEPSKVDVNQQPGFPYDAPNTTYGNILPFARNEKTGETSLAWPEMIRGPTRGIEQMALDVSGHGQDPGSNLTQDEITALGMLSPTSIKSISLPQTAANSVEKIGQFTAKPTEAGELEDQTFNTLLAKNPEAETKPLNNPNNIKISKDEPNAVSQAIDVERQKAYQVASASGAARTPQAVNAFLQQASSDPVFNAQGFTAASDKSALNLVGNLQKDLADKSMSIQQAQGLDQDLSTLKQAAFKNPTAPNQRLGYQYAAIQKALRDNIYNNPDQSTFIGDPEGWNALQEGNRLHQQYMQAKTVENLFQNGSEKSVPSTSIQTQFGNLARKIRQSGKGQMGFTPDQVAAINLASQSGVIEPSLRLMGSRLVAPLVGGIMGEPSGAVGALLGMEGGNLAGAPFRAAATALRTGKVNDILRTIVKDPYYNPLPVSQELESAPAKAPPSAPDMPSLQSNAPPQNNRIPMLASATPTIIRGTLRNAATSAAPSPANITLPANTILPQSPQDVVKPQSNANDYLDKTRMAESSGNPNAKNPNSSASGPYQFTDGTWKDMVNRYGKQTGITIADKNNPKAQATMAALYARDNVNALNSSLGRMPNKDELYMAHVLGPTGATKLISAAANNGLKHAALIFPPAVVNANHSLFFNGAQPRTALQLYQLLANKV